MSSEFSQAFFWYFYFVAIGWVSFPLAYTCFRNFPDRGFSLAKIQGIFLASYLIWISTSLGVTSYHRSSIITIFFLYLIINGIVFISQLNRIVEFVKTHILLIFCVEGIFLVFFLGAVIIRMYNPDITGAEKEADFTFLNAILHSKSFPPKDTWFAGATVNYYYFGYLIWATVIKLIEVISPIGFNLAIATIVALSAVGIFGLVYHFTRRVLYGIISSFFLMIFGNLDGLVQILERQGYPLPFDWWRSSRVLPDTINEFPYFSFLLGDLHAHFMAIPFVLLLIGLIAQTVGTVRRTGSTVYSWILLAFVSLSLGGTSVINGWDYPTYLIITGLCVGIYALKRPETARVNEHHPILTGLLMIGFLIVFSRLFFLPFFLHFSPQLSFSNLRFVASTQRTDIGYFVVIYGFFLWIILGFIYFRFRSFFSLSPVKLLYWNSLLLTSAFVYLFFFTWVLPVSCIVSGIFFYLWYKESLNTNQQLPTTNQQFSNLAMQQSTIPYFLLFMAFAIIAGCELLYIKDFYGHPLERQNTIFKFYYQAWIFLSIGSPYLLYLALRNKWEEHSKLKPYWIGGLICLCCACWIYPVFGTYEKTNRFRDERSGGLLYIPTLNGISYIAYREPDEYDALIWIQENIDEDAVILEATGKPYSFFGRVATTTGRPTVLGWGNHEALWRDQTWESIIRRSTDIEQIYETIDKQNITGLLQKYNIKYIYVGTLERQTYDIDGLKAFENHFTRVYENQSVTIYEK